MKTVKQLQLSGLLVLLTLLSACQSKPKDGQTDTYTSGVIAIAADESFQPIVQEEIDVFEGLFPLAGIVPRYVTEVDAVNLLLKDSLRLAITSRRLTPEEMNSFNSRKFFPQEIKIATDGLALITHLGNPDSLISVKDICRILTGGVFTTQIDRQPHSGAVAQTNEQVKWVQTGQWIGKCSRERIHQRYDFIAQFLAHGQPPRLAQIGG